MSSSLFRLATRRFIAAIAASLSLSLQAAPAAKSPPPPLIAAERHVAVKDACAWPMLTMLRDGTIVAIIHNQPSHGQREGEIEAWATKDGVTWEKRGRPAPNDPQTVRMNVAVGLARNGDLLVICSGWSDVKHPRRPKQSAFRDSTVEAWVCRSKDGGYTWTQQKRFVPARPGWLDYIPFGPILAGEDGALHASCYSGEFVDETVSTKTKGYRAWHFRSDDDGVTWRETSVLSPKHSETSLFHLGGKRWLAAARGLTTDLFRSEDDGATWQGPEPVTEARQIPAHLVRLRDGRLLLSYSSRLPDKLGVFAKISRDDGKTWSAPLYVAAMLDWDGGYPASAQRPDGKIITAYYAKRSEAHDGYHMAVALWDPPAEADTPRVSSSGETVRISKPVTTIISHQNDLYHGWASMTASRDGALRLVYSGGRDYHVCPFGRVDFMLSRDGGETWSWPRTIADSLTDDRDSGIVETRSGVLLASFYTSLAYQQHLNDPARLLAKTFGPALDATLARWRIAEQRATPAERKADIGYWLIRSTDRGVTWSARYKAPGYNPHGPTALADGRVFYAAADGRKAAAWISSDDGLTWNHLADLPTRAGELHAVEAADGTLLVHVRDKLATTEGTKQRTLQTESHDGGKTWSSARFVADGYPSHLARLQDGTLVCTYGSRTPPLGIRAKLSRDHGRSWSNEFLLTDDAPNWDLGYPTTAQLPDGSLVTVWYEAPAHSHLAALRQAKWRL